MTIMKIKYMLFVLLLLLVFTSCGTTFDGYSFSIEDARKSESFYNEYDYIFTVEQENRIVDFLIYDDYVRVIKIDCKEKKNKKLYEIKNKSTFLISESLLCSEVQREDAWTKTSNFPFQVEWMILPKTTESLQEGFCFIYNDIECMLLYRIFE